MSDIMEGTLRVWWINRPPRDALYVVCASLGSAVDALQLLIAYDLYLGYDDLNNVGGLEVFTKGGEWEEWYSADGSMDIFQFMKAGGI